MKLKTKKILMILVNLLILIIDLGYIYAIYSGKLDFNSNQNQNTISNTSQIILLSICSAINILLIVFYFFNLYPKKKGILIILNVIQIFLGTTLFNIIAGLIEIALITSKTQDIDEPPKEKEKLPELESISKYKWYVYLSIFVFLFIICYTPFIDFLKTDNQIITIITIIALYLIQIFSLIIPMWNELKRDFIVFKNNFKTYIKNILPRFGISILFLLISNVILIYFTGEIPNNQSIINEYPILISAFLAIIIAPVTEELMFRGFLKKLIKNDFLFILISSLVFGGLHILVADSVKQCLFIIPYSILGFALALNYVKTKNIASNIFLHSSWNSIVIIIMILTKVFN